MTTNKMKKTDAKCNKITLGDLGPSTEQIALFCFLDAPNFFVIVTICFTMVGKIEWVRASIPLFSFEIDIYE